MSLSNEILKYIKANPGTTFVEIQWIFERNGFDYKGNLAIVSEHENLILWDGWNKEAIAIFEELITCNQIEQESVEPLIYVVDGGGLKMPIAKRYQKYAKPRWFPIVFTVSK